MDDLLTRLKDQRITTFNAQMDVREQAAKEIERLREYQNKIEEAEGRCCPEDYGFEEYISVLNRQIAETRKWTGLADYDSPIVDSANNRRMK
jgi:hypothetical protein